jgi:hypothetical protein
MTDLRMMLISLSSRFKLMVLDVRPPKAPWQPLEPNERSGGALSFYYSDSNSEVPVREVTRVDDNKSDPNLETLTYGLFSTCERGMRKGIVTRGIEYLFFCTNRGGIRVLTGYYKIGWYFKGPPVEGYSANGKVLDDYALAASNCKFVTRGFPLRDLTEYLKGVHLDNRFRDFKYIDRETSELLAALIDEAGDETQAYLEEIKRLEQVNYVKYGYVYKNWERKEGFGWDLAPKYMGLS